MFFFLRLSSKLLSDLGTYVLYVLMCENITNKEKTFMTLNSPLCFIV